MCIKVSGRKFFLSLNALDGLMSSSLGFKLGIFTCLNRKIRAYFVYKWTELTYRFRNGIILFKLEFETSNDCACSSFSHDVEHCWRIVMSYYLLWSISINFSNVFQLQTPCDLKDIKCQLPSKRNAKLDPARRSVVHVFKRKLQHWILGHRLYLLPKHSLWAGKLHIWTSLRAGKLHISGHH